MTSKIEMIILPTETFSCISHAANSFVKEEKFTRRKENHFLFENSITGTLNTDNSYYDLSDISSLNLNTSKEESSSDDDDAIEFHIKN